MNERVDSQPDVDYSQMSEQQQNKCRRNISLGESVVFDPSSSHQNPRAAEMYRRGPQPGELVRRSDTVGIGFVINTVGGRVFTLHGADAKLRLTSKLRLITVGGVPCWELRDDGGLQERRAHKPSERAPHIIFDPSQPEEEQDPISAEMFRRGPQPGEMVVSGGICSNYDIYSVSEGIVRGGSHGAVEVAKLRPITMGWSGEYHYWIRVAE
ncbi:MAG: hypothetical protein WCT53_02140 [Candidatus Gracilibacteria bacterium]